MEQFLIFAPLILLVIIFIMQYKLFVRPEDLERCKNEMKEDLYKSKNESAKQSDEKFVTKQHLLSTEKLFSSQLNAIEGKLRDIKEKQNKTDEKIEKIYNLLIIKKEG